MARAKLVGINHIALEVDDIDAALAFYGGLLDFELRGRVGSRMAFLDAGDQFIALAAGRTQPADDGRHFGLVVDDAAAVRAALEAAGVEILAGSGLDFRDPWGNRIQIVQYDAIQFTKTPGVLRAMELEGLGKTPAATAELRGKGLED
jgi:lactoylglutathione lyase